MPQNPFLSLDRHIMGDIYTSREAMDNLIVLCDQFGSRFGGTPGEKQAADFMKAKLKAYGLQNVHLEPIAYIGWRRGQVELTITDPVQTTLPCITLPHSPPVDLTGPIIDLGDGGPVDFERHQAAIKGKIVMVNSHMNPNGKRRWVHRNEKYGRALLAGAVGFIFVNHYPGYGPATGGISPESGGQGLIPAISLAYEEGAFLQRLLRQHDQVTLHLTSTDYCEPMTSWNVFGDLPGQQDASQIIMLGSHYDGHDISQGAADPASGTVAVMEAARALAQYASDLPYTIRFALWGVEEIGLLGSKAYVEQHAAVMDNIRFYLNMDMAGAVDPKDIMLNEWPSLEPLLATWREEMALDFRIGQTVNAHSDHFPFMQAGVPTGGMGSLVSRSGRGYGHTQYDTIDKVSLTGLREAAALGARLALRMASEKSWPVQRRSQAEVAAILDSPDNREESRLTARVSALYPQLNE